MDEPSNAEWCGLTTEREYELWRTMYLHHTRRVLKENDRLRAKVDELESWFSKCICYGTGLGPAPGGARCVMSNQRDENGCECGIFDSDLIFSCEKCCERNDRDFIYIPKHIEYSEHRKCSWCSSKTDLLMFCTQIYLIFGPLNK